MSTPKRELPKHCKVVTNNVTVHTRSHPFYIVEYGYCNEKKLLIDQGDHNDILILYSISGVVRFSRNKEIEYVQPDTVVIVACNAPLIFNRVSAEWEYFYMIISGSHAKLYYNLVRNKSNLITVNPLIYGVLDWFIELMNLKSHSTEYIQVTQSMLVHNILYQLYQVNFDIIEAKSIIPVHETDVNIILKYIQKNYKEELTIDIICKHVHFSRSYFCKIFKEYTNVTLHQYISEFRVNKSKELLSYSKLSINAVANAVGFKNTLTYIRAFEKYTQMTPTEYRKHF
ncbi:helix-turn-helix domain-containing protein [Sporanaerobium hydrogeniformans]|uniref:helix-turn-helix domain-containing protein n=1 Tax=Sporanaerobium hydrogeniformans TaxID=3072179 RepID=UPI0015D50E63|nr:AraC family transcriptional regulator [Sporanaerobium hydrogeniformans]